MFKFSEQLRNECIEYFKDVCGKKINHEEADEYLRSLALLCSAFLD